VEVCKECIGNAYRPPTLTTIRRRSNICELVSRRTDTTTWFGLLRKKKRRRSPLCQWLRRSGTELRKEKNTFCSNNNILWLVGGASGFVLSWESVLVRAAQQIGTRQQSLKTYAGWRGNWTGLATTIPLFIIYNNYYCCCVRLERVLVCHHHRSRSPATYASIALVLATDPAPLITYYYWKRYASRELTTFSTLRVAYSRVRVSSTRSAVVFSCSGFAYSYRYNLHYFLFITCVHATARVVLRCNAENIRPLRIGVSLPVTNLFLLWYLFVYRMIRIQRTLCAAGPLAKCF